MTFWEAGNTDAEASLVRVGSRAVELLDGVDQLPGILEWGPGMIMARLIPGRITPQGKDIGNTFTGIAGENLGNVLFAVRDAGQVGDGVE